MQQEAEFGLAPVTPKKVEQGGGVLEHAVRCGYKMLMLVHQWEKYEDKC